MYKSLVVLACMGTISACAAPQAATADAAVPAGYTKVCEQVSKESTGSRTSTSQSCRLVPTGNVASPEGR